MSEDKPKNLGGRPDKYDPKYCEEMVEHLSKGYSKIASAGLCGICKTSMWRWEKKFPAFRNAIKRGETLSQIHWEEIAMKNQVEEFRGDKLNAAVWIFNMRNRFNWRNDPLPEQEDEEDYPEVADK